MQNSKVRLLEHLQVTHTCIEIADPPGVVWKDKKDYICWINCSLHIACPSVVT